MQQGAAEGGAGRRARAVRTAALALAALVAAALGTGAPARAQQAEADRNVIVEDDGVQLDFNDVELSVVIDTIARLTGKNMIYDDRVRGRVTIVSPTKISVDAAYAVFESVLQVKGFTTVEGPGGAIKVIPLREAKESSIETVREAGRTPRSDRFVTRLIPLQYISADAITNTLSPLVSKDASMVAYPPTNTVILTDSASNIRRLLDILQAIDVETYKEELSVIKVQHADAATLAEQLSEIFDAEVTEAGTGQARRRVRRARQQQQQNGEVAEGGTVRIITDQRTNSLVILASRQRTRELRRVIDRLDVPVTGGGRIHVYYLKHANAEDMAETLNALVSGQSLGGAGGAAQGQNGQGTPQALRAAITELAEGVTITADAPTNSLVIQASQEGFRTLSQVIDRLDIARPQVLVEALIMEVDVTDSEDLGFNGLVRILTNEGDLGLTVAQGSDSTAASLLEQGATAGSSPLGGIDTGAGVPPFLANIIDNGLTSDSGSLVQGIIRASATDNSTNILSAPHILTSDNEEAEILVGNNIPIITSRVQSAAGVEQARDSLATSVNVERQDIGVTLRVTPQISEGDQLRLEIFQEITNIASGLQSDVGDQSQVGVALSNRKVENTVVVGNAETVVIGGLVSDNYQDRVTKIPFLGDIPVLGWAFKTTSRELTKQNLLVFLTPHIIRKPIDLENESIRKREEFRLHSEEALGYEGPDYEEMEMEPGDVSILAGGDEEASRNPALTAVKGLERRYPLERMRAIEKERAEAAERARAESAAAEGGRRYGVLAGTFRDEDEAARTLQDLIDAGLDGTLVTEADGRSGALRLELRLGPYSSLERAEEAATVVREGFRLSPEITVVDAEAPGAAEPGPADEDGAGEARP